MNNVNGKAASQIDEETRLINESDVTDANNKQEKQSQTKEKKSNWGATAAGAVGGFVAGAAAGAAMSAAAMPAEELPAEPVDATDEVQTDATAQQDAPEAENVLLVNDEGVRMAHVEADSFSEAFAQARQQVGPGGVFEYRGQIYGTYYADEWNNMSAQERADYQQRVSGFAPSQHINYADNSDHHDNSHADSNQMASNTQMLAVEPEDDSAIHVLGVEEADGMTVAVVECDGENALLVDVDHNGTIDVMIHDDNHDGMIQENEYHNVADAGLRVENLEQMHAAEQGDFLYASQDMLPDYVNDADMIMNA